MESPQFFEDNPGWQIYVVEYFSEIQDITLRKPKRGCEVSVFWP